MKRFLRLLCFSFLSLLLVACTHSSVKNPSPERAMMFPDGSYQHEVTLQIPQQKKFHFSGAVEIHPDHLSLVAFSPFGTTMFRMTDDRKNKPDSVKTEIYAEQIKPHEQQMHQFYQTIKALLTLPLAGERTRQLETPSGPAQIHFDHIDAHGLPDEMSVTNDHFTLQIKVVGYEI